MPEDINQIMIYDIVKDTDKDFDKIFQNAAAEGFDKLVLFPFQEEDKDMKIKIETVDPLKKYGLVPLYKETSESVKGIVKSVAQKARSAGFSGEVIDAAEAGVVLSQ